MLRRHLLEEPPYAELALPYICVMKQNDGIFGEFGTPHREIVPDIIVEVATVDVDKVDRTVCEIAKRIIECGLQQSGKSCVFLPVACSNRSEHGFAVEAGMLVALPGIDRVGGRSQPQPIDGLAEGKIGIPVMRAELDKAAGLQSGADPKSKRRMLDCGRRPYLS